MFSGAGESAEVMGVLTPQKTAMRTSTIAEEPEEEDAAVSGARPQVLSASACQQVQFPCKSANQHAAIELYEGSIQAFWPFTCWGEHSR